MTRNVQPQPPAAEDVDIEAVAARSGGGRRSRASDDPDAGARAGDHCRRRGTCGQRGGRTVPAKSHAVVLRLESKWLDFLEKHGSELLCMSPKHPIKSLIGD